MTFTEFQSFTEWLIETDGIHVQETNFKGDPEYVTLERIEEMDPLVAMEVVITATDSGFYVGGFFADRYGGQLTFYP